MTARECEAAAQQLGLADTTVTEGGHNPPGDPPYCYFEGGSLKLDKEGTNTGICGGTGGDQCLCITADTL